MDGSTFPRLSVLENTAIGPGVSASQALHWTTQIATLAERLEFYRLWVVEHHGISDIGCSTPAAMIAHLAAATHRIRVGAGGVMLPNHAPMIVAEEFSMLQGLHPGRIDLGVGRGKGADSNTLCALRRACADDEAFMQQLDELCGFLERRFVPGHRYEKIRIALAVEPPPIFLLGSDEPAALLAASRGLPFVFAHHLKPESTKSVLAVYRSEFMNFGQLHKPYAILSVAVVGATTDVEAMTAAVLAITIRLRNSAANRCDMHVSDSVLLDPTISDKERQIAEQLLSRGGILVGDPRQLREGLVKLQKESGVDEIIVTTLEYDGPSRMRTLRAVADSRRLADI